MSIRIRNIQPATKGLFPPGISLEIDGFDVPELVDVQLDAQVDALVEIKARVLATAPLDVLLDHVHVTILREDTQALDYLEDLMRVIALTDHYFKYTHDYERIKSFLDARAPLTRR